ncbi:MAG: hypothetical protein ACFFD2_10625 [Promethearchaeota archaeon]
MDTFEDISLVIYIIFGCLLIIILAITFNRYIKSRNTPAEKSSFLFLLVGIVGVILLFVYIGSMFTEEGSLGFILLKYKFYFAFLITLPYIFVLFAVQTHFGNLLDKGRYYTIAATITYLIALIIDITIDMSGPWGILYYGVAAICLTPSIYIWIKLINVSRIDPSMDTTKFIFYLIAFSSLDGFYIHDFFTYIIYGAARPIFEIQIDFIDSFFLLSLSIFVILALLRSRPPKSK